MENKEARSVGSLLLKVGTLLMSSGANTNRVRITMQRIANGYNYDADFLITHRAIMLTIHKDEKLVFDEVRQAKGLLPNFRVVSGLSKLSWRIVEEKLSINKVNEEVIRLQSLSHYPRILVLAIVALACSSFCRLAGGGFLEMLVVYIGSFMGLFIKQELGKKKMNAYITVFLSSFSTTLITGGSAYFFPDSLDKVVYITGILYLIPGIPLINSLSDILDGYSLNGGLRAVNGFVISFAIAAGLLLALFIYNEI
ncbi:threonine/serine ThrE exporter family protein [Zunongwangia sp.]|uniref:threonine/serine ThrE exporter family protein n=1 Tax=Zunongwangia sp. TaxID=1965325 RepID=UPI003AA88F10